MGNTVSDNRETALTEEPQRPIDIQRDSAVTLALDAADDTSGTVAIFEMGAQLCMVTQNAVYGAQLADQTDPGRTNPAVRNSMQRLLAIGADNEIVARILLTAERLFKKGYLGHEFAEQHAIELAWQQTKYIASLAKMAVDLENDQNQIMSSVDPAKFTASQITLPTMDGVEQRFDAFAQKLGHAVNTLEEIVRLFYPDLRSKWIDGLKKLTANRYGETSEFATYINQVHKTLLFMRDMRNMVEHPKPNYRAKVFDFRQHATGQILVPSVEFQGSPWGDMPNALHTIMGVVVEGIILMSEQIIGRLCDARILPFEGFDIHVFTLPPEMRGNSKVRLSYGALRDGQITRCL